METTMMMLDQCEDVATQLAAHSVGLLSIAESSFVEATPVPFRRSGADLLCLVPRWASLAGVFEQQAEQSVLLTVAESRANGEYWLHCHGLAQESAADWPGFKPAGTKAASILDRYRLIQITPLHLETTQHRPRRSEAAEDAIPATL
jgi:hypothetical protein